MPLNSVNSDVDERWPKAKSVIKRVLTGRVKSTDNLQDFVHTMYDIYLHNAVALGKAIYQLFDEHVKKIYSRMAGYEGDALLVYFRKQWEKYRKGFRHLGKRCDFLKFQHRKIDGPVGIIAIGRMVWGTNVLEPLKDVLLQQFLSRV